jgi:hypothetical protein
VSDLPYALVQVVHNLGAAGVVAPAAAALWLARDAAPRRRLAWLSTGSWAAQAATGAGFAAVSWFGKGALPEVEGVALAALAIKLGCTLLGLAAGVALLRRRAASDVARTWLWGASLAAGLGALLGAAFLRWYL